MSLKRRRSEAVDLATVYGIDDENEVGKVVAFCARNGIFLSLLLL